jgi:hypothetical protein
MGSRGSMTFARVGKPGSQREGGGNE